jgi:hypothetical protein
MLMTEAAEADKPITVNDMLARSERLALADTSGNSESRAAVLRTIGLHYLAWGNRRKAAEVLERAAEAATTIDRELTQPPLDRATFAECLEARSVVARYLEDAEGSLVLGSDEAADKRRRSRICPIRSTGIIRR